MDLLWHSNCANLFDSFTIVIKQRSMIKQIRSAFILLVLSFLTVSSVMAQGDRINVVTTAVPFLRISPDARAGGMGDLGIATPADANAAFWNQAKIPFAKTKSALGLTYTPWLRDITQDVYLASLAGYHQLDEEQAISGSLRYFNLGNIEFTDFSGNTLGSGRPREFAVDFGYSRRINTKLSAGVALRYINSSLANGASSTGTTYKAGTAVAADLSIFHTGLNEEGKGLTWGVTLSNLGSKIGYTTDATAKDYIPANLGLGIAYTSVFDEENRITFGMDINKLLVPAPPAPTDANNPNAASTDSMNLAKYRSYAVFESWFKSFSDGSGEFQDLQFSLGAEYTYNDQFSVRAGYFYENKTKGNRKYFTVGAGLKYQAFGLNFSYLVPSGQGITRNPLSNTIRFGLVFDLSGGGDKK
jgi:hypothetical protein